MSTEDAPRAARPHRNVEAVARAGEAAGVRVHAVEFPDGTRTAADAAAAIGVELGQIVKSLVFTAGEEVLVALVAGDHRLDESRLAGAAGTATPRPADAGTVREVTGYSVGGVPPFGHRAALRTFVDEDLMRHREVWAAAGTPRHVFPLDPAALVAATGGVVCRLA